MSEATYALTGLEVDLYREKSIWLATISRYSELLNALRLEDGAFVAGPRARRGTLRGSPSSQERVEEGSMRAVAGRDTHNFTHDGDLKTSKKRLEVF